MKIALVQAASPDAEPPGHRLQRVTNVLKTCPSDVDLIVLPELWGVGYNHFDDYAATAECIDGPATHVMSDLARSRGCYIHTGSIVERTTEGALRNTALLLGPDGEIVHQYSKMHIFGHESREAQFLEPGSRVDTSQTPFGVVGAATCYDLRFPGLWTVLSDSGADIVIVPAAWPAARRSHWTLLTAARAVDNQIFVVACNATGTHNSIELGGYSRVVDPWGNVVGQADDAEGITVVDIDPALVARTRAEFPVLGDRLADYTHLTGCESQK